MATNGNDLITELLIRLRESSPATAEGTTRAIALSALSQCQRIVNLHKKDKVASTSFTPTAGRTLYQVSEADPEEPTRSAIARIESIRQDSRDLHSVDFRSLAHCDIHWLRRTGKRYELFSRVGGDLFVLYPALETAQAVTVVYTKNVADVVDGATAIDIADEYVPLLLDLAEMVLAARRKLWSAIPDVMKRVSKGLGQKLPLGRGEF